MKETLLNLRTVTDGLLFPEGPIALDDGAVLVVEIMGGRLIRVEPNGRKLAVADLGGGPNGAAIGPDGQCYVCNNGGFNWSTAADGYMRPVGRADDYVTGSIQRVDLSTGRVETLFTACDGEPLKGPNDIVFDGLGGFYFTDHGKTHGRLMDRGAVYYAAADGSFIREVGFPFLTPNGIGLSPDGRELYVSETETGRLWAFPVLGPGELGKAAWPSPNGGRFVGGPLGYQRFDSMAVEANGNICVATLVRGGVSVFSPEGEHLEFHEAPEGYCTNIAFGGPERRTAFITLSGYGRLVAVDWEREGLKLRY
ncbi:MAG: SMP-30/gluconolactonase/LRE family protein [Hyphomonadaceae bacterium]|nr:SMP-30/gluconolactonase/LRE family protein [Hyphomonadaceae bacterium]